MKKQHIKRDIKYGRNHTIVLRIGKLIIQENGDRH